MSKRDAPSGSLIRLRFAPSPTGQPHVGIMRTALFNWLFARHSGGAFIVRIEDTDRSREQEGSLGSILEGLRWLGLDWDEGPEVGGPYAPYTQSERRELYADAARRIVASGNAYECDCTPERLEEVRQRQRALSQAPGYDGRCRYKTEDERAEAREAGRAIVVRMRIPENREVAFWDHLRGTIKFESSSLTDFVILKSDGFPTYHLAHIVDDIAMKISHVLRGEEWIASAPRHRLIYDALGEEMPVLVHLPILLGRDRSKLSKRHGAASVLEYRDRGYLSTAVVNFLALLGWSAGDDTEVMSRDELVRRFDLGGLNESAAIFDIDKLQWMNGVHIRQTPAEALSGLLMPVLDRGLPAEAPRPLDRSYVRRLTPLIQERMKLVGEAPDMLDFFFVDAVSPKYDDLVSRKSKMDAASTVAALESALTLVESASPFEPEPLEAGFRALAERLSLKPGQLFGAVRVAVTGKRVAPPLFDTLAAIGRERCVRRISAALELLSQAPVTP